MAYILVKNSLSNSKAAKININFTKFATTNLEGEEVWLLEASTTYLSASGANIAPVYVHNVTSIDNVDSVIEGAISEIAKQIDWEPFVKDKVSPYINSTHPIGDNVSMASNIYINIKDKNPSSGIDLSEAIIILNNGMVDTDITNDCTIRGNPLHYTIEWKQTNRVYKHYEEG